MIFIAAIPPTQVQMAIRQNHPCDYSSAIDIIYSKFTHKQKSDLSKNPERILIYHLPEFIEKFWLKDSEPLLKKFNADGITNRTLMSLFVVRGVQMKINGEEFHFKQELEKIKRKQEELDAVLNSKP